MLTMLVDGVERDEKKAVHYYELAAMGGHVMQGIILAVLRACRKYGSGQ